MERSNPLGVENRRVVEVVHAVLDGSLAAFGLWTLMYEVAAVGRLSAWTTGVVWVPLAVLVVAAFVLRAVRRTRGARLPEEVAAETEAVATRTGGASTGRQVLRVAALAASVAAVALTLLFMRHFGDHPGRYQATRVFWLVWLLLVVAALLVLVLAVRPRVGDDGEARPGGRSHLLAGAITLGVAAFTMFIRNPSADDTYYVNLSVWTAARGTFSLRDTMFGPQTYPLAYGGGVQVSSIEGLLGSMAHLVGMSGAAFTYLVAAPVLAVLSGWSIWRLTAAWAPRRAVLAYAATLAVFLFNGTGVMGDFGFARIWQGKVVAVCLVMPTAWYFFTRLARQEGRAATRWNLLMVGLSGLAFAGLTPTAELLAPLMSAAVVLAALVTRTARLRLFVGAVLYSLAPLLAGVAVVLFSRYVGRAHGPGKFAPESAAFVRVLGHDQFVVALVVAGLLAGPLLVRSREARALAAASALAALAVLVPEGFLVLNDLTNAGSIAYRLLLVAPLPLLTGLLVTVPVPRGVPAAARRPVVAALSLVFVAVLALDGSPVWGSGVGANVTSSPTWKVNLDAKQKAEKVLALPHGPGPVLLPTPQMKMLPLMSTTTFAVVPRELYLKGLMVPDAQLHERTVLGRFESKTAAGPPAEEVVRALRALRVSLACVSGKDPEAVRTLQKARFHHARTVAGMVCMWPPGYAVPASLPKASG